MSNCIFRKEEIRQRLDFALLTPLKIVCYMQLTTLVCYRAQYLLKLFLGEVHIKSFKKRWYRETKYEILFMYLEFM